MNKTLTVLMSVAFALFVNISSAAELAAATSFEDAMSKAEAATEQQDWAGAATYYRQAIDFDPNSAKAHKQYMWASGNVVHFSDYGDLSEEESNEAKKKAYEAHAAEILALYEGWAEEDPDNAVYQWALGEQYMYKDYAKMEAYMNRAIELDPKMSAAYRMLALIWEVRGDAEKQLEYSRLAAESSPDDPDPNFYYALTNRKADYEGFKKRALAFVERFPEENRGAQALYWLAYETKDVAEKTALYERLRDQFPIDKFSWSASGMDALMDLYAVSDPDKALALAESMNNYAQQQDPEGWLGRTWGQRLTSQKSLMEASKLIESGEYQAATALLEEIEAPRYGDANLLHTMKAKALNGTDHAGDAYAYLLGIAAEKPTDPIMAALYEYGEMLDKGAEQVNSEIRESLEAKAEPLDDYSWKRYDTGEMTSLSDYRGKVVLMNMWYPFCGPCRGENPHLQEILEMYGDEGFVILNINVHPEEDEFVMPYITGNHFDFIPVAGDMEWAEAEFNARGMPTNVLVDTQGRKVLRLPPISGSAVRTMELQIEFLLPTSS